MNLKKDLDKKVIEDSNLYLAYLRVKNDFQNFELKFDQEVKYFENNLEENLNEIKNKLMKKDFTFQKFDFIVKFKKVNKGNIDFRPLVRFRFNDAVLMQSIFNVIADELKNFLPKENLGVQLTDKNSPYFYERWTKQYKEFTWRQRENLSENTVYQYCYEYDIKQFYPSIQQDKLIEDLDSCLEIKDDSIIFIGLKKIIKYYNEDNISKETLEIFNKYKKRCKMEKTNADLGLPQGALYSPFLASFYTRNLFNNIRIQIKNELKLDCEIFAYVDDGRIYFKDQVKDENSIEEIIQRALQEINGENNKKIILNTDKSYLINIDEKSVVTKLNFLTSESSLINNSINPNFEIDQDTISLIVERHKQIKKSISNLKEKINQNLHSITNELDKNEKRKLLENEKNKLDKTYSTYVKRKATFLTKKISSNEEFYTFVDEIITEYREDTREDTENLNEDICSLNYYYVIYNLFYNAKEDKNKIKYLCRKIAKMLESYENILGDDIICMIYYYLSTIKAVYEIDYSVELKEFVDSLIKKIKVNSLIVKSKNSFKLESWYRNFYEDKNILTMNLTKVNVDDFEQTAIDYYLVHPYTILFQKNYLLNQYFIEFGNSDNNYDIELAKKYSTLNNDKKCYDYNIYILRNFEKIVKLKNDNLNNYIKLDNNYLDDCVRIKILIDLVKYWKNELEYNKYIRLSYLKIDNIYISRKSKVKNIFIIDNTSEFYETYKAYLYDKNYLTYFLEFFTKLFNCENNIIINNKSRALKFWEYRILAYLNNKGFRLDEFLNMLDELLAKYDYFNHDVDINYERIRTIVDSKLLLASDKDIIMQLHYFVQCIWKNGSKDLTFFTLHNQEHSVELIQNYMNISQHLISKLQLSKNETFLLFSACYLHDIGMLKGLTDKEKYDINNGKILHYYREAMNNSHIDGALKIENTLNKFYEITKLTCDLFENIIRSEHANRSAVEIQNDKNLPIGDLMKNIVAEVSKNHGEETQKVYGLQNKKIFRNENIDIRKISMWLRLLDLTDITKYRVTQEVFDRYFDRMGIISRFHWIKHLCVDKFDIISPEKNNQKDIVKTIRRNDIDLGKIELIIQIRMNYLPPVEIINKECDNKCECIKFGLKENMNNEEIYTRFEKREKCGHCNLKCAFLNEFKYFDNELEAINKYAETYNQDVVFNIEYLLDEESKRDDFIVLTNYHNKDITATQCIKEYFELINK